MTETCENCRFWKGKKSRCSHGVSEAQGYDKKWKDVDNRQRQCQKVPSLPYRLWDDWCGEFQEAKE